MDEPAAFVCMRVATLRVPHVPSVEGRCFECGERVWLSPATDAGLRERPGSRVVCQVCTFDEVARSAEPVTVRLLPGTVEEVARWREGRR
jgi:hypothetical protein